MLCLSDEISASAQDETNIKDVISRKILMGTDLPSSENPCN